jgi:hypothetical protein
MKEVEGEAGGRASSESRLARPPGGRRWWWWWRGKRWAQSEWPLIGGDQGCFGKCAVERRERRPAPSGAGASLLDRTGQADALAALGRSAGAAHVPQHPAPRLALLGPAAPSARCSCRQRAQSDAIVGGCLAALMSEWSRDERLGAREWQRGNSAGSPASAAPRLWPLHIRRVLGLLSSDCTSVQPCSAPRRPRITSPPAPQHTERGRRARRRVCHPHLRRA